jgi:beta-N-acetylhexosaminidase
LVEQDAIAGIHVTRRNLSVGVDGLRDEIATLQAIRAARGRPPLLIAADHEGGVVSHLAPPLNKLPGLGVVGERSEGEREAAARDHARVQGADLRRLGVNLNFAPVVDLRLVEIDRRLDRFSRIDARAISHTPTVIEAVASWYCEELRTFRVACTLKHFPGLGRVREDTHFVAGRIDAAVELLMEEDWAPFRTVASSGGPSTLIMVAHAIVAAIDRDRPASRSRALIGGVIREGWAHQGVLVTDDLSMLPISRGPGGVSGASFDAVRAGIDYLLIAYDPDLFYEAAAALLRRRHEVPPEVESASILRRADLIRWLTSN